MTEKEMAEYSQWMWSDTMKQLVQAVAIYGVALMAYWGLVG